MSLFLAALRIVISYLLTFDGTGTSSLVGFRKIRKKVKIMLRRYFQAFWCFMLGGFLT